MKNYPAFKTKAGGLLISKLAVSDRAAHLLDVRRVTTVAQLREIACDHTTDRMIEFSSLYRHITKGIGK